jgi:hypothetical protein
MTIIVGFALVLDIDLRQFRLATLRGGLAIGAAQRP